MAENSRRRTAIWLLRSGLAFAFLYVAAASFIEPDAWLGYLPLFLRHIFPPGLLLPAFSVYEILLALWILSGWKNFYAAILAAITLLGIIVLNFGAMDIVFRDISIFFAALALAVLHRSAE